MKLTGTGKWKTWLFGQKKAMRRKLSAVAFFAAEEMNKGLVFLMLFLFVPYIITVLAQDDGRAERLENRLQRVKGCPRVSYQSEHGEVSMPIEIYLKGVLGGYLYTQDFETKLKYRQEGELILYEGLGTVSEDAAFSARKINMKDLAIRFRTNLYVESMECCEGAERGEGDKKEGETGSVAGIPEARYYCTNEELAHLYGDRWGEMEKEIEECIQSTTGFVYGRNKTVARVSYEKDPDEEELEIYVAW